MTHDAEMKEVQAPSNSVSSVTDSSTLQHMKVIASLIETGAYAKEVRWIVRAVRLTIMLRRKLREPVVYAFLSYALAPGSDSHRRLSSDLPKLHQWMAIHIFLNEHDAFFHPPLPKDRLKPLAEFDHDRDNNFVFGHFSGDLTRAPTHSSSSYKYYFPRLSYPHLQSLPLILYEHIHGSHQMDAVEDVVIIGAGIAGLATALGLHRKGVRSLVLESSESLRAGGFGLTTWTNAWRAMDALGVGESLRQSHVRIQGVTTTSATSGARTSNLAFMARGKSGEHEVRCLRRNMLLETLEKELPLGTVRYSSKVVAIEEDSYFKLVHLADSSTLKTKVLIGCDGVNSVVARWLGLKKPTFTGRLASRGLAEFPNGHGFKPEAMQYYGEGFRTGLVPCNERIIYWFFTWSPSEQEKVVKESPTEMKRYMLSKLKRSKVPEEFIHVIEISELSDPISAPLRYRWPFSLLWGNISKGNICVAGDAFHPMTPDIAQGGCSALEDSIVLVRCLSEALLGEHSGGAEGEYNNIKKSLEKYGRERRWRSFQLIATAYVLGRIQQSNGAIMGYLRDRWLSGTMARLRLERADFDCGKL